MLRPPDLPLAANDRPRAEALGAPVPAGAAVQLVIAAGADEVVVIAPPEDAIAAPGAQ
jgi:hypothetical protein